MSNDKKETEKRPCSICGQQHDENFDCECTRKFPADKTTEQLIPQDTKEFSAIQSALSQIFWDFIALSEDGKAIEGNPAVHRMAQWVYEKLHSLPPSPVGEAGYENRRTAIAFNNFVKDGWVKYSDGWGNAYSNMRERYTDEQLYDLFVTNQPSPSRAGEISPVLRERDEYRGALEKIEQNNLSSNPAPMEIARTVLYKYPAIPPTPAPEVKGGVDLNKLQNEIDELFDRETPESLRGWYTKNVVKDSPTEQPAHVPDPNGNIREDIMDWIRQHPDANYVTMHGVYTGFGPDYWAGVMRMYRQQLPVIAKLTEERDAARQDLQKMFDQVGTVAKEGAKYREALETIFVKARAGSIYINEAGAIARRALFLE